MKKYFLKIFIIFLVTMTIQICNANEKEMPDGFVFLSEIDNSILQNVRYFSEENFIGTNIKGYETNKIICTKKAAEQLKKVNDYFKNQGFTLVVYDAYRPQKSVNEFGKWSQNLDDLKEKKHYYPTITKKEIIENKYIAQPHSTHSRGSTFDLTLIKNGNRIKQIEYLTRELKNGEKIPFLDDGTVDMGSSFDLFHVVSHPDNQLINAEQIKMRNFLIDGMKKFGFKVSPEEWWHFTLEDEPFPETYFDFPIKDYK